MDIIVPVLLFTSALIGAAAGLRYKVFVLVPITMVIVLFSASVLHMHGFRPGSGIFIMVACLVVNQAAYMIVQILAPPAPLLSHDGADGVPSSGGEQAVRGDNGDDGNQKPSQFAKFDRGSSKWKSQECVPGGMIDEHENSQIFWLLEEAAGIYGHLSETFGPSCRLGGGYTPRIRHINVTLRFNLSRPSRATSGTT